MVVDQGSDDADDKWKCPHRKLHRTSHDPVTHVGVTVRSALNCCRQRVLRCLHGDAVDKVPVDVLLAGFVSKTNFETALGQLLELV